MSESSDPIDQASAVEEQFTQSSIEAVLRQGGQPQLIFKGRCHNCEEKVPEPLRFCDQDCMEDWEYVQKRKRANGYAR